MTPPPHFSFMLDLLPIIVTFASFLIRRRNSAALFFFPMFPRSQGWFLPLSPDLVLAFPPIPPVFSRCHRISLFSPPFVFFVSLARLNVPKPGPSTVQLERPTHNPRWTTSSPTTPPQFPPFASLFSLAVLLLYPSPFYRPDLKFIFFFKRTRLSVFARPRA